MKVERPLTEIGVSALIAAICIVFLVQAMRLPPGTFEPLGSGPVPIWTASIVLICCAVVIVRGVLKLRQFGALEGALSTEFKERAPGKGLMLIIATLLYVAALDFKLASFGVISFVYLTVLIWALSEFRPRALVFAAINGALFAFGAEYLFTNVFFVDLPV